MVKFRFLASDGHTRSDCFLGQNWLHGCGESHTINNDGGRMTFKWNKTKWRCELAFFAFDSSLFNIYPKIVDIKCARPTTCSHNNHHQHHSFQKYCFVICINLRLKSGRYFNQRVCMHYTCVSRYIEKATAFHNKQYPFGAVYILGKAITLRPVFLLLFLSRRIESGNATRLQRN